MSNLGYADEVAAGGRSDREPSPTPSADTQTGHPKGVRSVVRKRYSSHTTSDREIASWLQSSTFIFDLLVLI